MWQCLQVIYTGLHTQVYKLFTGLIIFWPVEGIDFSKEQNQGSTYIKNIIRKYTKSNSGGGWLYDI